MGCGSFKGSAATSACGSVAPVQGCSSDAPAPAPPLEHYQSRKAYIEDTAQRAITLRQLSDFAAFLQRELSASERLDGNECSPTYRQRITWQILNMYHICAHFVQPLTLPFRCSFVELVADAGAQPPTWFVSHWWGSCFRDTVSLLSWHARCHGLPESSAYWVCTFANNQHDVSGELGGGILDSPFVRAIEHESCNGTVLLLDPSVTPMRRVWCVLEAYITAVRAQGKRYDLCAVIPEGIQAIGSVRIKSGPALLKDMGSGCAEELCEPAMGIFPFEVAEAGAQVNIALAQASNEGDRRKILHLLAGSDAEDQDGLPPASCKGYDAVNTAVRDRFRGRAMYICAWRNDTEGLGRLLEESKSGLDERSPIGATQAYVAARRNSGACLRMLLDARCDPDGTLHDGNGPAHVAAERGHEECLWLLLEARAQADLRSSSGSTPVRLAKAKGHRGCLQLLLGAGADDVSVNSASDAFTIQRATSCVSVVSAFKP